MARYDTDRDFPAKGGVSGLSAHLHFGEISPLRLFQMLRDEPAAGPFVRQLIWREFALHLLLDRPDLPDTPMRPAFAAFPWQENPEHLARWQRGQTGYPLVDAGMRELWHTGYMHNRVRMVTASFLVKHLLQPWQAGAAWFWNTLVDADLANNTMGWQWVAGCGPDAAPYFRVFNPITQGTKFDPDGTYIRRWVPELSKAPKAYVHEPWKADPLIRRTFTDGQGRVYPNQIVDHAWARERTLKAYEVVKNGAKA